METEPSHPEGLHCPLEGGEKDQAPALGEIFDEGRRWTGVVSLTSTTPTQGLDISDEELAGH